MNNMLQGLGSAADEVLAVGTCSGRPGADDRAPSPYSLSEAARLEANYPYHFSEGSSAAAQHDRSGCEASLRPAKRRCMPPCSPSAMLQASAPQSSTSGSGSDSEDALAGRNQDCYYRLTHHQPTHQLLHALAVHGSHAQPPQHQQCLGQGLQQPLPNVSASIPGPVEVYVHGTTIVRGIFRPDLYLSGQDCIEWEGQLVSRSRFEKEGGSTAAKWYCSIKVAGSGSGDKQPLGAWLQERNLPVLKGASRRSRQQRQAEADRAKAFPPQRQPVGGCPANIIPATSAPVTLTTCSGGPALIRRPVAAGSSAASIQHTARAPSPGTPPPATPTANALYQRPTYLGTAIAAAIAATPHPTTSHTASLPDQHYGPWHRPLSCPPAVEEPLPCTAAAGGSSLRTSSCGLPPRLISTSICHPTDACKPTHQLHRALQAAHPANNSTGGSGVPSCSSSAGASHTAAAVAGGGGTTLQLMPLHLLLVKVREYATGGTALPYGGLGGQCAGPQPGAGPSGAALLAAAEPEAARAPAQEVAAAAVAGRVARPRRGSGGGAVGVRGGDGVEGDAAAEGGYGGDDSDYEPDADVDQEDEGEDEDD